VGHPPEREPVFSLFYPAAIRLFLGLYMIRFFLKRLIIKNKELILSEAQQFQGFLHLLFKQRNTDLKWTKEEKEQIKNHLKRLSLYVPILIIFILPGGSLMLPFLAEILDRRKTRRIAKVQGMSLP
jgi:hypothetical protein